MGKDKKMDETKVAKYEGGTLQEWQENNWYLQSGLTATKNTLVTMYLEREQVNNALAILTELSVPVDETSFNNIVGELVRKKGQLARQIVNSENREKELSNEAIKVTQALKAFDAAGKITDG